MVPDTSPPAAPDKSPAFTLNTPPMLVPEPIEIEMLQPDPDADKPLQIPKEQLSPMLRILLFSNRSPNTTTVPALLVNTATLPKLVDVQMPNKMVMEPPKAVVPSLPSIVTAPPLVLPSSEARVKTPLLLVTYNLETIAASPPDAPNKLLAVTLNATPLLVLEPTKIALLPPKLDAGKPLPITEAPLPPTLLVPVSNNRSPNLPTVPACLVHTAMLPELVAVPIPNEVVTEPPKTILPWLPGIVTAPPLVLPSPKP
jgi:hypothetical protein